MEAAGMKSVAASGVTKGSKPRLPLPKRGSSLGPGRLKTQAMMESSGKVKGLLGRARGATPTSGTAAGSTAFSKRSGATVGAKDMKREDDDLAKVRPSTEFIPSASQEFGEKVKQGRLRPTRQKSKSN